MPDGGVVLAADTGLISRGNASVRLTRKEFDVVQTLWAARPRVLSRVQMMERLYDVEADEPDWNIVAVFISRLRPRLAEIGVKIVTHWGRGWSIEVEARP